MWISRLRYFDERQYRILGIQQCIFEEMDRRKEDGSLPRAVKIFSPPCESLSTGTVGKSSKNGREKRVKVGGREKRVGRRTAWKI